MNPVCKLVLHHNMRSAAGTYVWLLPEAATPLGVQVLQISMQMHAKHAE